MAKHLLAGDIAAAVLVSAAPAIWFLPCDIAMAAAFKAGRDDRN